MTETRRRTESEHQRDADAAPHDRVEVFDTDSNTNADPVANPFGNTQREALNNLQSDPGFGNADLHNARVVTGNGEPTTFRPTDLRDSELNTTIAGIGNNTSSDIGAGQGTNWATILMVIAIILVIILLGSWIF